MIELIFNHDVFLSARQLVELFRNSILQANSESFFFIMIELIFNHDVFLSVRQLAELFRNSILQANSE